MINPYIIAAAVVGVLLTLGWARESGRRAGVASERSSWVLKQQATAEAHAKAVAEAVEQSAQRAREATQRAEDLATKVKEIEDASRNQNRVCVSGPDADRIRRLRRRP